MLEIDGLFLFFVRWGFGLLLLIFGANGIFHFIPAPAYPPAAEKFRRALVDSGYMLPCWKAVELVGALLLIADKYVPFSLVILAPVLVNIFLFHWFLSRRGLWLAAILILSEAILALAYRNAFANLFI